MQIWSFLFNLWLQKVWPHGCFLFNLLPVRKWPKFGRYPAFGIPLPLAIPFLGIDVSHYQSAIDWDDVKPCRDGNIRIGFPLLKHRRALNDMDNFPP